MQQERQAHQQRAERLEALLQEIAAWPDLRARATAEELIQTLLDMYGEGLERVLELVAQAEGPGSQLTQAFANDELVSALFLLHGLYPVDLKTRIARAIEQMQSALRAQGSSVELIAVEQGVARLCLIAGSKGCAGSSAMLKQDIEEALYQAAPDLEGLEIEDGAPAAKPVMFIPRRRKEEPARSTQ